MHQVGEHFDLALVVFLGDAVKLNLDLEVDDALMKIGRQLSRIVLD